MCMCACVRARKPKIKQKSNIEKNLIRVTILNFFKSGQVMKNLAKNESFKKNEFWILKQVIPQVHHSSLVLCHDRIKVSWALQLLPVGSAVRRLVLKVDNGFQS